MRKRRLHLSATDPCKVAIAPQFGKIRECPPKTIVTPRLSLTTTCPSTTPFQVVKSSSSLVVHQKWQSPPWLFASQFTRDMRTNQGWSTVHVIVEPIEFQDLPPLGNPTHTEGDMNA